MTDAMFERRKERVRYKLRRQANGRVRLCVFRSGKHIYAQMIDDKTGKTVVAASSMDEALKGKLKSGSNLIAAKAVGELVAKRALEAKLAEVVFDRGGYLYHGRVRALAEAAREAGLKF